MSVINLIINLIPSHRSPVCRSAAREAVPGRGSGSTMKSGRRKDHASSIVVVCRRRPAPPSWSPPPTGTAAGRPGCGAVVVVDDGNDPSVEGGHGAQVGARQPAEGSALQPLALAQEQVQDLVVRRARVGGIGHGLRPRIQQGLGAVGRIEEGDGAADVWSVLGLRQRLVAPVVEEQHVAVVVGPAARHEQVGEAVELKVGVEEDHGQRRRHELAQNERGLHGDGLEAELLGALGRVGAKGVARQLRGLAADPDALARAHEPAGLGLVAWAVQGDADELVRLGVAEPAEQHVRLEEVHAALLGGELARVVLVARVPLTDHVGARLRAGDPQCVVGGRPEQPHVHAGACALRNVAEPVRPGAAVGHGPLGALVLRLVRAVEARPPAASRQAAGHGVPLS
eukprot:scaffold54797_cov60-Phaeocystis_antarctica.AAC.4